MAPAIPLAAADPALASGPDLTRYLLVCALLVAGIAGLGWGFKRLFARSWGLKATQRSLRIVDLLPLSGKHRLAVVRCYDRTFVLGLGERELNLICELDGEIAAEDDPEPRLADHAAFGQIMEHLRARQSAAASSARPNLREGILG